MKRDTLIKHKEVVRICEENGHVNLNHNVLLTTLEANTMANTIVKPIYSICCYNQNNIKMYQLW
jgi:hypothetical protein